ncbi:MAG: C40 family peptidase, partial [Dehalococcoidia bacterium]|nr:C40 family peptidase [Dehalococcoidia bacterium]
PDGTMAKILNQATDKAGDAWFEVEVAGTEGWVYGSYLEQISEEEADQRQSTSRGGVRNTAADIGMQYVGYRYVWGGTSPQTGFDSSGFLFYVYKSLGTPIPRDYWGMMAQGTPVSLNQLQPGDLVFFVNTYTSGLSHGGIYIGNGQFVHAVDERRGVKVDSIWADYYISRFYGARRIL